VGYQTEHSGANSAELRAPQRTQIASIRLARAISHPGAAGSRAPWLLAYPLVGPAARQGRIDLARGGQLWGVICLYLHMTIATDAPFRIDEAPAPVELVAKYFRALGDPTRLRLLERLDEGEASVGELVEWLGLPQPQVSKHLACLRWCGFVRTRREHRIVYYRVADPRVPEVLALGRALLAENAEHVAACRTVDGDRC